MTNSHPMRKRPKLVLSRSQVTKMLRPSVTERTTQGISHSPTPQAAHQAGNGVL